jgi:DNA invertase Pin-like site-specific DNA recombinase
MRIGYGRVATRDQNPDAQQDVLTAADCEQIFIDKALSRRADARSADRTMAAPARGTL